MWEAWPASRPWILAHRALAPGHRENTLEGVQAAFLSGADAVEVDVRCSGDEVPLLFHDSRLDGLPVGQARFSVLEDRARELGHPLARVSAVLEAAAPSGPVNLEIKDPAATQPVLDRVGECSKPPVLVSSFHPEVLRRVEQQAPQVPTGLILGPERSYRLLFSRRRRQRLDRWLADTDPELLVAHRSFLRFGLTETLLAPDRPIVVWTVNRGRRLKRLMRHPLVSGVITDRPARAHHARGLLGSSRSLQELAVESRRRRTVRSNQDSS